MSYIIITWDSIEEVQQQAFDLAEKMGFHDHTWKKEQDVMWMVAELGELFKAYKYGKITLPQYWSYSDETLHERKLNSGTPPFHGITFFEERIKNTLEDEMADVLMLILASCKKSGDPIYKREYRKQSTGSIYHDLLRLNHYIMCAYHHTPEKDWGYTIAAIFEFCVWYGINLSWNFHHKMIYNSTRPVKHGYINH